jgi:hypothetical protein
MTAITVTAAFGSTANGCYLFVPNNEVSNTGATDFAPLLGNLDTSGNLSVSLDNSVNWIVRVVVEGLPEIRFDDMELGDTTPVTLFALLASNGYCDPPDAT